MKKVISILLVLVIALSLCSCGGESNTHRFSSAKKIAESEIRKALGTSFSEGVSGKLDVETSGEYAKSFTWTISNINAETLLDKSKAVGSVNALMSGMARPTEYKAAAGLICVMQAIILIDQELAAENTIIETAIETAWSVACANEVIEKDGWTLSATVNKSANSITITGKQIG